MFSAPEPGTIAARVLEAQARLEEAGKHFLMFDIALDVSEHEDAAAALRLAYDAARDFTRNAHALLEDVNGLLEWEAPLGVWLWACSDPYVSPLAGDNADNYPGAYVRHFANEAAARVWLASQNETGVVGNPLYLVNHGIISAPIQNINHLTEKEAK